MEGEYYKKLESWQRETAEIIPKLMADSFSNFL
jgi:hypothetical protein